ncbi:hypothetical protein GY45DRAFT_252203 [Cubamyces sp. BRFM 1775]|nr:hypothetical protein GY45DRAFT_252203 [Cubamyces sp. BRFM 1775]
MTCRWSAATRTHTYTITSLVTPRYHALLTVPLSHPNVSLFISHDSAYGFQLIHRFSRTLMMSSRPLVAVGRAAR